MAIPGMDLQAQYEQTLQNTIGKSQRDRLQDVRKQQTLANTDWSQRGVGQGAQRMAGFQEVNPSSMPNMSTETRDWIKPLLGTYQEGGQNVEGFYGKDNPYTQDGLETILGTQGYTRAPTSLEGQFKAAGLKLPNAYGQNYYNAQYESVGNEIANLRSQNPLAFLGTDPNLSLGQETDLNRMFNDLWAQQKDQVKGLYYDPMTLSYKEGLLSDVQAQMMKYADPNGPGGPSSEIQGTNYARYAGNDYASAAEAEAQRQATYNYLNTTQDKNLLRNAIIDMKYGSGPGSFGFTDPGYTFNAPLASRMGSDVQDLYSAYDKRAANTNIGKLGWNGVNEKITDANFLAQLFGGRTITGADGANLGYQFTGDNAFIDPTQQHTYLDNSRSGKNLMNTSKITDIQNRYATAGAQLNPTGLQRSGLNDLYIKSDDIGKLSGEAYGGFENKDIWNRQKSPTTLGRVAKFALDTFGGPFGKIAGLALGNATGQTQASIGQVAMTAASMFGGGAGDGGATDYLSDTLSITPAQASALYQGATLMGGTAINGGSLKDSLLSGASGAAGGYLGNETGNALKGLFDNKLVGDTVSSMGSSAVSGGLNKALLNKGSAQDIALNSILAGLGSSIDGYMSPKDKQTGLATLKSPSKTTSMYNQSRQRTT